MRCAAIVRMFAIPLRYSILIEFVKLLVSRYLSFRI